MEIISFAVIYGICWDFAMLAQTIVILSYNEIFDDLTKPQTVDIGSSSSLIAQIALRHRFTCVWFCLATAVNAHFIADYGSAYASPAHEMTKRTDSNNNNRSNMRTHLELMELLMTIEMLSTSFSEASSNRYIHFHRTFLNRNRQLPRFSLFHSSRIYVSRSIQIRFPQMKKGRSEERGHAPLWFLLFSILTHNDHGHVVAYYYVDCWRNSTFGSFLKTKSVDSSMPLVGILKFSLPLAVLIGEHILFANIRINK